MNRRASVLLMTMVIVALAAMIAVSLLFRAGVELRSEAGGRRGEQARQAAESGIARAIALLRQSPNDRSLWYDNDELFKNQLVFDAGQAKWYFTIYAPPSNDSTELRCGVIDEAGKINVNIADEKTLLAMPGMNPQLVDSLLDWRDSDDKPRANGAEHEYYGTLQPMPYHVRNGHLATVEELMLVKGFDASLVLGEDFNLNGLLEANEDDGGESHPPDDGNGELDTGLAGLLTTVSYEFDVDNEGEARVNINGGEDDLKQLNSTGLDEGTIVFIELYRAEGKTFSQPGELLEMQYKLTRDHDQKKYPGAKKDVTISSHVAGGQLAVVMDKLTSQAGGGKRVSVGLVNVNSAGAKTLASLPEIDENLARQIVSERSASEPGCETIAWLVTKGLVDAETFRKIAPKLTARGLQFRIRCVGFGTPSGQFCVLEAVVDMAKQPASMLYMRDITRLGLPRAIKIGNEQ